MKAVTFRTVQDTRKEINERTMKISNCCCTGPTITYQITSNRHLPSSSSMTTAKKKKRTKYRGQRMGRKKSLLVIKLSQRKAHIKLPLLNEVFNNMHIHCSLAIHLTFMKLMFTFFVDTVGSVID